jgi:hypothetical protein
LLRATRTIVYGGPISIITLQNISSSENTHNIDIISQFIAGLRLGDPLEAGEEFLQYVFDRLEVRLWCEPARTELTVLSSEVFNEHVARNRTVLLQVFRDRNALNIKLRGSSQRSGEERELKPSK